MCTRTVQHVCYHIPAPRPGNSCRERYARPSVILLLYFYSQAFSSSGLEIPVVDVIISVSECDLVLTLLSTCRHIPVPVLAKRAVEGGGGGRPSAYSLREADLQLQQRSEERVLGRPSGESLCQVSSSQV